MNEYMGDNGVFDSDHHTSHGMEFTRSFTAAFAGAMVGQALGRTRFGYWYNTSPSVGWILRKLCQGVVIGVGIFSIVFLYELVKIW